MTKLMRYIFLSLIVTFFSEIYFSPFQSAFKLSAAIIVLDIVILSYDDISVIYLSLLCSITVFAARTVSAYCFTDITLLDAAIISFPSMVYYIIYGISAKILNIKRNKDKLFNIIIFLSLIDSLSNIVETILRGSICFTNIKIIVIAGLLRSFTAYFIYVFYNKQKLFIENQEHQKRYTQLNMMIANIQAEIFYLKKSMKDIEKVMSKSHNLYQKYNHNDDLREATLDISREIHEIKKDYYRIISGFESFMEEIEEEDSMTLSSIFTIIKDNTERYLKQNKKYINISYAFKDDFLFHNNFYFMFTILNNLIINSIDACRDGDIIKVREYSDKDNIIFEVYDSGEGIEDDVLPYIFNPGFTTKYDETSGNASTGMGLPHVKNIVEELGGSIKVDSNRGCFTIFKISIPKNSLIGG